MSAFILVHKHARRAAGRRVRVIASQAGGPGSIPGILHHRQPGRSGSVIPSCSPPQSRRVSAPSGALSDGSPATFGPLIGGHPSGKLCPANGPAWVMGDRFQVSGDEQ